MVQVEMYLHETRCRAPATVEKAILDTRLELIRALHMFPRAHASPHEGFAILKEEVDELWDEVKAKDIDGARMDRVREEAVQVAAMALRFIIECCG